MIHNNPDLIASYSMQSKFIDPDGKLMDLSGNGNDATITPGTGGFTTGPDGKANGAYEFDGADTKIDCESDIIGTQAVSISAWIYANSFGETAGAIVQNVGFDFNVLPTNERLIFSSDNSTPVYSAKNSISTDTWAHVVVTRTAAGIANFYIDGVLSGNANQDSGTPTAGANNVIIGNRDAQDRSFDGFIANVEIYNAVYGQDWVSHQYKKFQQQIAVGKHLGLL